MSFANNDKDWVGASACCVVVGSSVRDSEASTMAPVPFRSTGVDECSADVPLMPLSETSLVRLGAKNDVMSHFLFMLKIALLLAKSEIELN
jgi:hypothetical protein